MGAVSDNFDERIEQKIFHSEIVVDTVKISSQEKGYQQIPQIRSFVDKEGHDRMQEEIEANYKNIKADIRIIIEMEIDRISNDPDLKHLINRD